MACGTPVVALDEPALREVAGDAAVFVAEGQLAEGVRQRARGARPARRGRASSGRGASAGASTAERTLEVYREALGRGEGLGRRRLARARARAGGVAAGAGAAGRRARRDRERAGQRRRAAATGRACSRARARARSRRTSNAGVAATSGEYVLVSNPGRRARRRVRSPTLVRFADEHPRAGLVGPLVFWPDGTWQPSLRRFPTVLGTIWRRTPLRRLRSPVRAPGRRTTGRGRPSRCRATGCSAAPAC